MTHTSTTIITKVSKLASVETEDYLMDETPLSIRLKVGYAPEKQLSITMRTRGDDEALAVGFIFNEGIITSASQIKSIDKGSENEITITLESGVDISHLNDRKFISNASCGVCGKSSLDDAMQVNYKAIESTVSIEKDIIFKLEKTLRENQKDFNKTGGGHAVGLFDLEGKLLQLSEDIGRHNALDKLIGHQLLKNNLPLSNNIILLSGRIGYELVQKSLMSGVPIIAAIGAPSSISCSTAKENKLTLIGFLKESSFNVYSGVEKIIP